MFTDSCGRDVGWMLVCRWKMISLGLCARVSCSSGCKASRSTQNAARPLTLAKPQSAFREIKETQRRFLTPFYLSFLHFFSAKLTVMNGPPSTEVRGGCCNIKMIRTDPLSRSPTPPPAVTRLPSDTSIANIDVAVFGRGGTS